MSSRTVCRCDECPGSDWHATLQAHLSVADDADPQMQEVTGPAADRLYLRDYFGSEPVGENRFVPLKILCVFTAGCSPLPPVSSCPRSTLSLWEIQFEGSDGFGAPLAWDSAAGRGDEDFALSLPFRLLHVRTQQYLVMVKVRGGRWWSFSVTIFLCCAPQEDVREMVYPDGSNLDLVSSVDRPGGLRTLALAVVPRRLLEDDSIRWGAAAHG